MPRSAKRRKVYRRRSTKYTNRRRSYGRRRRVYRRRRRFGGSKRILRVPTQLQQICFKTFKWTNESLKQLTIPNGAYGVSRQINLNNLYQCDSASTPPELIPRLQEFCALYLFCKVHACKVTVKFYVSDRSQTGATITAPLKCYIAAIPYGQSLPSMGTSTDTNNLDRYIEGNPYYCTKSILGSDSNNPGMITLNKYYKNSALLGNKKTYDALTLWDQPISTAGSVLLTGPTNVIGCQAGVMTANRQPAGAGGIYVGFEVSCKYYVKFWGNKYQIE